MEWNNHEWSNVNEIYSPLFVMRNSIGALFNLLSMPLRAGEKKNPQKPRLNFPIKNLPIRLKRNHLNEKLLMWLTTKPKKKEGKKKSLGSSYLFLVGPGGLFFCLSMTYVRSNRCTANAIRYGEEEINIGTCRKI